MLRFRYRRWLTYPATPPVPWFARLFRYGLPILPESLRAGLAAPAATKPTSAMRPIITVTIQGPTDALQVEALLDTGEADRSVWAYGRDEA